MRRRAFFAVLCLALFCWGPGARADTLIPGQNLLSRLNSFIETSLSSWKMSLSFASVDSSRVEALSFQNGFKAVWNNVPPGLITKLDESVVDFTARSDYSTSSSGRAVRPGVNIRVAGREWGDMLAMRYDWSYTWEELSDLLGGKVTSVPDARRLFTALTVVFSSTTGESCVVVGTGGVDAASAADCGALVISETGTGVLITLTACLTNVRSQSNQQGPQIMEELLIVPDGTADTSIAGTVWLLERKSAGTASSSGGGGCNAGLGILALLTASPLCLSRRGGRRARRDGRGSSAI